VDGSVLENVGRVTFAWEESTGASYYLFKLDFPNGSVQEFTTENAFFDLYPTAIPLGGEYQWQVIAMDEDDQEMCRTEYWSFSKPAYNPTKNENTPDQPPQPTTAPQTKVPDPTSAPTSTDKPPTPPPPTSNPAPTATSIPPTTAPSATPTLPPIPTDDIMDG
jgi:hypothetical protein